MSVTLRIDNFTSVNTKEATSLASDVEIGATSLPLLNNNNIVINDFILVGRKGSETAEIRTVASVTGATIATSDALTLRHNQNEDVIALIGNQIKVYRALNVNGTAPSDASFAVLGSPINIDPDQLSTDYTDEAGSTDHWYKYTFFNSATSDETAIADSAAVRGGGIGIYSSLDEIRSAANFSSNRNITDSYISGFRQSAQDQVNASLAGVYVIPFSAPVNGFIKQIVIQLAAGHIKLDQFSATNAEGNSMITWAENQLKAIKSGDLTLTDTAGTTLPQPGSGGSSVDGGGMGFSGYPNNVTQNNGFMFTRETRY